MTKYFAFKETTNHGWMLCPSWDAFWTEGQMLKGSFQVICARVAGLSWPEWLRFCRQNGATLYGKEHKYVCAIWKEPNKEFEKMMNVRAAALSEIVNLKELDL